ncbi:hypothetical protein [Nocardia asteroides]|uniref:Uncharacterized protein n=1 Tax=Nocardia asteroides NBRC 15531 TaxID=1110697 RepID=U5E8T4_NOCAS|nr:hypothetical protein [Nocardia asteroides]UGT47958.1 hypothetical protein LT345_26275 [Nocardia asteroides]GAD82888.1 hypothetical protein NCAST_13_01630 [Nocardia asteroides NBRC 15531]SFM60492.1 hypothetical protein SAMN05444423_103552 [Nocardia asteroides]VEG33106.1 Uncharacterised protein [Nocardia asteroides]
MVDLAKTDANPLAEEEDPSLAVVVEPEGLLVAGDPEAVESYLERLKSHGVELYHIAGVTPGSATGAASLSAGLGVLRAQHGTFVKLRPQDAAKMSKFGVMPGNGGYHRMSLTDGAGKIRAQLQWKPVSLAGTKALSLQMTIATVALQTAIAEATAAVERVEGKVEQVLDLVKASTSGDVLGQHAALIRIVRAFDESGVFPAADWDAIASLGPAAEVVVERLRAHIRSTLDGFDAGKPVQQRAEYLRDALEANRLGAALDLLVVAEDSLYQWQRLRIERVRNTEPQLLEPVIDGARAMLAEHLAADGRLLLQAREQLAHYAAIRPLEIARKISGSRLKRDMAQLKADLDGFAAARRSQVAGWQEHEDPRIGDALAEIGNRFKAFGDSVRELGARGVDSGAAGVGIVGRKAWEAAERRRNRRQGGDAADQDASEPMAAD